MSELKEKKIARDQRILAAEQQRAAEAEEQAAEAEKIIFDKAKNYEAEYETVSKVMSGFHFY
jgi:hypothetical protein